MPNWCNNTLEINHTDKQMLERARKAIEDGRLFEEFIPVPEDLKIASSPSTKDEELQAKYEANKAKHGYATWYEFCVNEWGTKWDVGGDDGYIDADETSAQGSFQSAWSPPMGLMVVLEQEGFTVEFMYYEPGMNFAGVYRDGNDDYYELPDTADETEETLPTDLDEAFGISENMRQWEEENQE